MDVQHAAFKRIVSSRFELTFVYLYSSSTTATQNTQFLLPRSPSLWYLGLPSLSIAQFTTMTTLITPSKQVRATPPLPHGSASKC